MCQCFIVHSTFSPLGINLRFVLIQLIVHISSLLEVRGEERRRRRKWICSSRDGNVTMCIAWEGGEMIHDAQLNEGVWECVNCNLLFCLGWEGRRRNENALQACTVTQTSEMNAIVTKLVRVLCVRTQERARMRERMRVWVTRTRDTQNKREVFNDADDVRSALINGWGTFFFFPNQRCKLHRTQCVCRIV